MATLIVVYNSEGVVGRCDARCYNAKPGTPCDCCCGGVNHAVGLVEASQNVGKALSFAEEYARDLPGKDKRPLFVAAQLGFVVGDLL